MIIGSDNRILANILFYFSVMHDSLKKSARCVIITPPPTFSTLVSVRSCYNSMLVVVKGGFWDIFDHTPKKSRSLLGVVKNVPEFPFYNFCNRFGDTFWPSHTLIFSKSSATPKEFPFHIVAGKKNSPNLGYGLAWPRIFRGLSKEISLIHPLNFFQSMFLGWM